MTPTTIDALNILISANQAVLDTIGPMKQALQSNLTCLQAIRSGTLTDEMTKDNEDTLKAVQNFWQAMETFSNCSAPFIKIMDALQRP